MYWMSLSDVKWKLMDQVGVLNNAAANACEAVSVVSEAAVAVGLGD
jgi:hypothetical protein